MGAWAKYHFGQADFDEIGIVVAGAIIKNHRRDILGLFHQVVWGREDMVFHGHLAEKDGVGYPILFDVFGASAMLDALALMHDGGCRTIIFVGSAYGFLNLGVGSVVIPNCSYHFEEVYNRISSERRAGSPDDKLKKRVRDLFDSTEIDHITGTNVSIPAVTFKPPLTNEEFKTIQPTTLEMELSACLSRAKEIGMRAIGILIVGDNHMASMGDVTVPSIAPIRLKILKTIVDNMAHFRLPPLLTEEEFSIERYFDSVCEEL